MKDKQPTDEEVIKFFNDKIPVLEARVKYQRLDTEMIELTARKYEALNRLAMYQNKEESKSENNGDKSTGS